MSQTISAELFTLETFIGNEHVVQELRIELEACRRRRVRPDHMLIMGASGGGKTRLANTVAHETGRHFLDINSPLVKDLFEDVIFELPIVRGAGGSIGFVPSIIFFDEAHELSKEAQSILLKIMLEGRATIEGQNYDLSDITIILATTNVEKLLGPLKQRCELRFELRRYTVSELTRILQRQVIEDDGALYQLDFPLEVAYHVAQRARFTPRIGNQYMKRIYQHARHLAGDPATAAAMVNLELADSFFRMRKIGENGLTPRDLQYLRTLSLSRKPMGVATIAAQMDIESEECKRDIEPFLRCLKLINFTKSGREITPLGRELLVEFERRESLEEQLREMVG